jgi:hypothetical protein
MNPLRSPSRCAIVLLCVLALGNLSGAQTPPEPYACDLPTLPAAPNPIPTCQSPCDPFPPPGPACATCNFGSTCTVTTMLELTSALRCLATTTPAQCTHITIPSTATIAFCDTISIGNEHAGLHLTIDGTLLWVAPAALISDDTPTLIRVNGVRSGPITIDGSGTIISIHEPCRATHPDTGACIEPNANAKIHIGYGIRILDSDDIHVQGTSTSSPLIFQKLSEAVKVESDTSNTLALSNLKIEGMTNYGVFIGAAADDAKVNGVTILSCHVKGAYFQHGFRIYANNVTIENCSACRQRASGLWIVQGKNIMIDGFEADEYLRLGPNHECNDGGGPEKGERLMGAHVRDVNVDYVEVQSGVIGCWLDNITMQTATGNGLRISYSPGGNVVARPTNRIHWGLLQGNGAVGISGQTYPSGCNGTKIGPCPADIDDDEVVDIDDLLGVISNWGACPTAVGACWFDNICHPHWTSSACASAGGDYQGNGTDCWTHPASAPCCSLNSGTWTCAENIPPFACWNPDTRSTLRTRTTALAWSARPSYQQCHHAMPRASSRSSRIRRTSPQSSSATLR